MRLPQVQTDFQRLTSRGLQTDYYMNYLPFYAKKCGNSNSGVPHLHYLITFLHRTHIQSNDTFAFLKGREWSELNGREVILIGIRGIFQELEFRNFRCRISKNTDRWEGVFFL